MLWAGLSSAGIQARTAWDMVDFDSLEFGTIKSDRRFFDLSGKKA